MAQPLQPSGERGRWLGPRPGDKPRPALGAAPLNLASAGSPATLPGAIPTPPAAADPRPAPVEAAPAPSGARRRKAKVKTPLPDWFPYVRTAVLLCAFLMGFRYLHVLKVYGPERAVWGVGIVLFIVAVRWAVKAPSRLPLLMVVYFPYADMYPFKIPGVPGGNMTNLLMVLAFMAGSLKRLRHRKIPYTWYERLVFVYLGWVIVSHLHVLPQYPGAHVIDWALVYWRWATPYMVYLVCRRLVATRSDIQAVMWTVVISIFLAGYGNYREGVVKEGGRIDKSRTRGIMGNANTMGAFQAYYGTSLLALLMLPAPLKRKAIYVWMLYWIVRGILVCFSRGAYLSLGLAYTVMMLLRGPHYLAASAGGLWLVANFAPGLLPESVFARFAHTKAEEDPINDPDPAAGLDKSSLQRLIIWQGAYKMAWDYPLFGVGTGQFPRYLDRYHDLSPEDAMKMGVAGRDPHNMYLAETCERGFPALVLMCLVILGGGWQALLCYLRVRDWLARSVSLSFIGTTACVILSCIFGSRFIDIGLMGNYWIILALVAVLLHEHAQTTRVRRPARARAAAAASAPVPAAAGAA